MSDERRADTAPNPVQQTIAQQQRQQALQEAMADQEARWRTGTPLPVEHFLEREPNLAADPEGVLDLIYKEVLLRTERGDLPQFEEYARRFPHLADALGPIFEIHQALESEEDPAAPPLPTAAGPPARSGKAAAAPAELPGYELMERLGQGGMGVVYKARQKSLDRTVALKMVLAGALAGPEERARFGREAEVVAKLAHPNIVQIFEVGEHEGRPFLALEFVEGGGLDKKLRGTPQPPGESAQLIETLARAVHHAHLQGVVHRDLKPANVLLTGSGAAKIADFGLARLGAGSGQTQSGDVLGTPSYMAPEQATGRNSAIGPATDVYALGATLYELLTGRPPFRADNPIETLLQVSEQEPISPSRLRPNVPRDLETICLKCLQKAPEKRYASAEALADDLRRFLDGHPILARPTPVWERALKWARRRPAVAALYTVSAAAVVAIVFYNFFLQSALSDANNQRIAAQKASEERRRQLVQVLMAEGSRLLDDGDWLGALQPFAQAYSLDQSDPARAAIHQIRLATILRQCPRLVQFWPHDAAVTHAEFTADGRRALTVTGNAAQLWEVATGAKAGPPLVHGKTITEAVISHDGRRIATAADDRTVQVWDAATCERFGAPIQLDDAVARIALIAGGERAVIATRPTATKIRLQVWDVVQKKTVTPPLTAPLATVCEVAISPDGRLAATSDYQVIPSGTIAKLTVWNIAGAQQVFEAGNLPAAITKIQFSPDGARVAGVTVDAMARVWNCATKKQTAFVRQRGPVLHFAFSQDGRRFATAGLDGTALIWDSDTSKGLGTLKHGREFTHAVQHVAFSPDGNHAVTAGADNTARVWNLKALSRVGPPLRHAGKLSLASFSPDGRLVLTASGDQAVRVWDLASHRLAVGPLEHGDDVTYAAFDHSGQWLATASDDRTACVWDVTSGRPQGAPLRHTHQVVYAAFDADGHVVTTGEHNAAGVGEACVWDPAAGTLLFRRPTAQRVKGAPDLDRTARRSWFSPDGRWLLALDGVGKAEVWDVRGQQAIGVLQHGSGVTGASFSADGRHVLTATFLPDLAMRALASSGWPADMLARQIRLMQPDKTATVWEASGGKRVAAIGPWSDSDAVFFRRASFGPAYGADNSLLLLVSDGEARLWDVALARATRSFRKPGAAVVGAALSPDGRVLATTSDDESAQLWDAATGELLPTQLAPTTAQFWYAGQSWPPLFSPDGRLLVLGGIGGVRAWDISTGNPVGPTLDHPGPVKSVEFSPDGRLLLTTCDRAARVWDLTGDGRSAEDWLRLAQFLSCSTTHPQAGRPVVAGSDQPGALWDELVRQAPHELKSAEDDVAAWRREAARACEKAEQWQAALFHWNLLDTRKSERPDFFERKGRANAEVGRWAEAAADFQKATELGPEQPGPWYRHALVRLHLEEKDVYGRICTELHSRFGSSEDPSTVQTVIWTCVLGKWLSGDGTTKEAAKLTAAAERLVVASPKDHVSLRTLGAVYYRAGRYDDAVRLLNASIENKGKDGTSLAELFLAMAHRRLGQNEMAKTYLERARRSVDALSTGASLTWAQRLELTILRREAEAVLKE